MPESGETAVVVEEYDDADLSAAESGTPTELFNTARSKFEAMIAELEGYALPHKLGITRLCRLN